MAGTEHLAFAQRQTAASPKARSGDAAVIMNKPVLRLAWAELLDDEHDPLLGRGLGRSDPGAPFAEAANETGSARRLDTEEDDAWVFGEEEPPARALAAAPAPMPAPAPSATIVHGAFDGRRTAEPRPAPAEETRTPIKDFAPDRESAREDAAPEPAPRPTAAAANPTDPMDAPSRPRRRAPPRPRRAPARRSKLVQTLSTFGGTFLFGLAALLTLAASAAPFGAPFDMISSYRWYWTFLAFLAAAAWLLGRGRIMALFSVLVAAANLLVMVPTLGAAPKAVKAQAAMIGWANLNDSEQALARVLRDADQRGATLLMLARAPASVVQTLPGWSLIEAPAPGDPTAIAVLSRGADWRAATIPGEPTMARPATGALTVIGVHPEDPTAGLRRTPMRDALINRAATRAGTQSTPTLVVGDFNAAAWDGSMRQFAKYGAVTRIRCGGWTASTYSQFGGLVGLAVDHAFSRDLRVLDCRIGGRLPQGRHKPLWITIAPQTTPAATAPAR